MVTIKDIESAAERIAAHIHRTPVVTCAALNARVGAEVYLKCENLQKAGAFKSRGAINAVAQLSDSARKNGVVTHSSGNHAAALARAAAIFECAAHIVMPSNSMKIKKAAVQSYGGRITECEPSLQARLEVSAEVQMQTGATMVPPFDHEHIIAGQGTCALEFLQEVPDLDMIIAPVGGGGLMAGTCIAAKALNPDIQILGGEPKGADDAFRSLQSGQRIPQTAPNTIADGLRTSLGDLTWPVIRDHVGEIITVDDQETVEAMRFIWERSKLIIEPSSDVPIAAIIKRYSNQQTPPKRVGVIISGGNVDLANLPWKCTSCIS